MAPDITKIAADHQLVPGLSAWNFCDEVMRCRLHGIQSRSSERPAHPMYRPNQPHSVGARVELRAHREAASRCSISKPARGPGTAAG
jgi:hypothetical protein